MCGDLGIVEGVLTEILNIPGLADDISDYLESRLMAIIQKQPVVIDVVSKPRHGFQRPIGPTHLARAKLNLGRALITDGAIRQYFTDLALVCFYWD